MVLFTMAKCHLCITKRSCTPSSLPPYPGFSTATPKTIQYSRARSQVSISFRRDGWRPLSFPALAKLDLPGWTVPNEKLMTRLRRAFGYSVKGRDQGHLPILDQAELDHRARAAAAAQSNGPAPDEHVEDTTSPSAPSNISEWKRALHNMSTWDYRVSAASVAISFLERLPSQTRSYLRNIVLDEDSYSVLDPESHALGLIPFCQENKSMRIERRVDLWRAVFLEPLLHASKLPQVTGEGTGRDSWGDLTLLRALSKPVASWIMEATVLSGAGMPDGCFTLVFENGGDWVTANLIRDVVQFDTIWQEAYNEALRQGLMPNSFGTVEGYEVNMGGVKRSWERHGCSGFNYQFVLWAHARFYTFEGFPQVLRRLAEHSVPGIKFAFDVPWGPWEEPVEQLVKDNSGKDSSGWDSAWEAHTEKLPYAWAHNCRGGGVTRS